MSSTDELKTILPQEAGHNLVSKFEGHPAVTVAPEFRILLVDKNTFTSKHWNEASRKQNETESWDFIWSNWLDEQFNLRRSHSGP
jgi:hypothetical protein